MFSSLPGGPPKPEPEQVIRNYTEELKTAPDEVGITGATLRLVWKQGAAAGEKDTGLVSAGRAALDAGTVLWALGFNLPPPQALPRMRRL